jgi:molybdopterin/thiamine biosynthesis adenylyltransferase
MLSEQEKKRYNRQIILEDFGEKGQEELKNAKVLVVGIGGLGSVVSTYLVACGVGVVGLMDNDVVSLSNLQRQVLYREDEVDVKKSFLAKRTLLRLNSNVKIVSYECFLTKDNANEIIKDYDLVIDCLDNYTARYVLNDSCVELKKPFIYGSIGDRKGQLAVFNYGEKPANYRNLFPNEDELVKRGNINKGVLGILPSIIGSMQVNEAIKIITKQEVTLKDTLFMIDLQTNETMKFFISH